eukprot:XP_022276226.1 iron-sulfur cluster assembly 1 homolog, mitochondrial isoform X4 [Canis lupus familiaris]
MRWLHKHKASGDGAPTSTPWCGQQAEQSLVTQLVLLDWPRILFSILASSWRRGQVLLPPPSKPESSRDLPWSLHQCVYEPGAEGRSRGGENLKRTLSMEPNRTRDCDLGHNQKSDT